tara:strand:+ start:577 stop:1011 length:435 start_codon:yes stop_codon:yes gene_type:complete
VPEIILGVSVMINILSRLTRFAPAALLLAVLFWAGTASVYAETGFIGDQRVEVKRISQGRFIYPRAALRREIEGFVKIQVTLGETGRVIDAFVLEASPPNRFEKNALKFVRSLAYEPYRLNGVPQRVEGVIVPVRYELQRVASR